MVLTIPCNLISNRYSPIQDLVKSTTYEVSFDKLQDKLSSQKKTNGESFQTDHSDTSNNCQLRNT